MVRSRFYQGDKKVFGLLLTVIIFFIGINGVWAKMLTINEVSKEFNESDTNKELNQLGLSVTSSVDEENKLLNVYSGSEKLFSFKYTDEYIEYDNRSTAVTEETATANLYDIIGTFNAIESIIKLSGYENKSISEEGKYTDGYETIGLQLITEPYNFSSTEDDGAWDMSGEFLKYFKMSLDTSKIDTLMEKYGVDISTVDTDIDIINNLTPTIKAKDITKNSVTLYPHINYTNTDSNNKVYCNIYRSTSENGTYEKVSDMAVNCLDEVGFVDKDLKSNTTYYYKTMVVDGSKYSEVIEVTTKATTTSVPNDEIENPKTGAFIPILILVLMLAGGICVIVSGKKKSIFKKI